MAGDADVGGGDSNTDENEGGVGVNEPPNSVESATGIVLGVETSRDWDGTNGCVANRFGDTVCIGASPGTFSSPRALSIGGRTGGEVGSSA